MRLSGERNSIRFFHKTFKFAEVLNTSSTAATYRLIWSRHLTFALWFCTYSANCCSDYNSLLSNENHRPQNKIKDSERRKAFTETRIDVFSSFSLIYLNLKTARADQWHCHNPFLKFAIRSSAGSTKPAFKFYTLPEVSGLFQMENGWLWRQPFTAASREYRNVHQ